MNPKQIQWWRGRPTGPLGTLYSKSSWADLSDWSSNGSTPSVVTNQLVFSGGTGTYQKTLDLSSYGYTCLENWSITAQFKVGTKDGTSYGFGVGTRSYNQSGNKYDSGGQFLMYTGTGSGSCYSLAGQSGSVIATQSASPLTFSVNDIIEMVVTRAGFTLTCTCRNVTTSSSTISATSNYSLASSAQPIAPNTGRFCVFSIGGTFTLLSYVVSSTEQRSQKILHIGDSKAVGYCAGSKAARFADIVAGSLGSTIVHAGAGDASAEMLLKLPETLSLYPQIVVLNGLSNDVRYAVASGTYTANYASIVSQLVARGIRVVHTTGLKEGIDQSPLQTYINSNYSAANIIDTVGTTLNLNVDGIHPSATGHTTYAGLITSSGKIT